MKIFTHAAALQDYLVNVNSSTSETGFIPTMGALHDGHIELLKQSVSRGLITICSIFVNPTQFNNPEDFDKYPKTLSSDAAQLERAGADILFAPDVSDIYPGGTSGLETFDLGYLETILEGSSRPGHFQGVCQVMKRLLTIIAPRYLFMGQKDYQQCMVVSRLLQLMESDIQLITAPTVRQTDGLALSSRNQRLSSEAKQQAAAIYQTLLFVNATIKPGDLSSLHAKAVAMLTNSGFTVDYVAFGVADTLEIVNNWDGNTPLVCLIAAFIDNVRLIDNMQLSATLPKKEKNQ
jgi:pantoate--beta-alanine ligase